MRDMRNRALGWLGRRYLARKRRRGGFDLSAMSFLPDSALLPLQREGLDPVPGLREKHESEGPVSRLPLPFGGINVWLVTGYEEAKAVLGDASGFSNDFNNLVGKTAFTEDENPGGLGFKDPPDHTRLRRILTPEFTMRRLNRLTPRIQSIVDNQLEGLATAAASGGPVDLLEHFALPIPALTICELLGVDPEDRDEFQRLATGRFDLMGGMAPSFGAMNESMSYFDRIVKKQRENPGDDLLGMIVQEHGDTVDDRELTEMADGLLTGGLETTASTLALGIVVLLQDREWLRQVQEDDEAVKKFVDEALRYLTVVQVAFPRFARQDVEVGGVTIGAGDVVICSLIGANRDTDAGERLDEFDPSRKAPPHLAFGHGVHRCIGAELGRMELKLAYPSLVRRFPEMRMAVDPSELTFRKRSIVYGVESLPVHPE